MEAPTLQVLISAYGEEGLRRLAASDHPVTEGVEYLVSWQTGEADPSDIPSELMRPDMKIYPSSTKGLSVNRNAAITLSSAPLLLIGDDDVDYTADGLKAVMNAFEDHPDCDILAFRYRSDSHPRHYPDGGCLISNPPRGYYICSIEIGLRSGAVKDRIRFNENFGIGAFFPAGEEDVFIKDCSDAGLKGIHVPVVIERHEGATTSDRYMMSPERPMTMGAVMLRLHPRSWPLRMPVHALREIPGWLKGEVPSPISFISNWLKGVSEARRRKVFGLPWKE